MHDATWLLRLYARRRLRRLARMDPQAVQRGVLSSLVRRARGTKFGPRPRVRRRPVARRLPFAGSAQGLRRILGRLLARAVPPARRLHLAGPHPVVRRVVGNVDRDHEVHSREPGDAPVERARGGRAAGPPPRRPAGQPAARRARLHARRLDRAGPPRAGSSERRSERHRGGGDAGLGEAALFPAARPGGHRRLGGEDRTLRRTLAGDGDHGGGGHAELAADLLRAPRRDRRGEAHRRHLARARAAVARRRRLGALPRPLRRAARRQPGGDPRGLPGERGVLRCRRPRRRRGAEAAARYRDLLRVRPARPAGEREPGLPLGSAMRSRA